MKRFIVGLGAVLWGIALAGAEFSWPGDLPLDQWGEARRLTLTATPELLRCDAMGRDSYIVSRRLNLDPASCHRLVLEYRAQGLNPAGRGQLYYLKKGMAAFSDRDKWIFSGLQSDGQWHTLVVTAANLVEPECWYGGGVVTALRLDVSDDPGEWIEIRRIVLDDKAELKAKPTAVTYPEVKSQIPERAPHQLRNANFQGGMMRAAADIPGAKTGKMPQRFSLRRVVAAPEKLDRAYIQFTADDEAELWINGKAAAQRNGYNCWKKIQVFEVTSLLKPGADNVLVFDYRNTGDGGGVIMELVMRDKDGRQTIVSSGRGFRGAAERPEARHRLEFDDSRWPEAVDQGVPPTPPWRIGIPYVNFRRYHAVLEQHQPEQKKFPAGALLRAQWILEGAVPKAPVYGVIKLFDRRGGQLYEKRVDWTAMTRRLGENRWQLDLVYRLPQYLSSNEMLLVPELEDGFLAGLQPIEFSYQQRTPGPGAAVKVAPDSHGTPQLQIDGESVYPLIGNTHAQTVTNTDVTGFSSMPMTLRSAPLDVTNHLWWLDVDTYDFTQVDWIANRVLEENPDCRLLMWVTSRPPYWFGRRFADEALCFQDGGSDRRHFSFAGDAAFAAVRDATCAYIRHVRNAPYRDRVAGYALNNGETIEWLGWFFNRNNGLTRLSDYSPVNRKKFAEFAARHYPALGANAAIPTAEARRRGTEALLLTPEKDLAVIAYNDYHSAGIADFLIRLGMAARRELRGEARLLGCYYGYTWELPGMAGGTQLGGHRHLKKVLDSGLFDFIMSPPSYQLRGIGEPAADMKPFRSLADHNVLSLIDDDTRTHLTPAAGFAQTLDAEQSRMVMRRNVGMALCRNQPVELLPLTYGNEFNAPELIADMGRLKKAGDFMVARGGHRRAGIAAVVSEAALKYLPMEKRHQRNGDRQLRYTIGGKPQNTAAAPIVFAGEAIAWQRKVLSEFGAPVDYLLAEDLPDHLGDYRVYIFLNPWSYDDAFLQAVRELRRRDTILVWLYAPGWIAGGESSVENMKTLTGMDFRCLEKPPEAVIVAADGTTMGVEGALLNPAFAPVGGEETLRVKGVYRGTKTPGWAEWRSDRARQIFCGTYRLSREFLRQLAREEKIHLYGDGGDFIDANSAFVMLHAATPGRKRLYLPEKTDLLDIFAGTIVARNVSQWEWKAPWFESRLFYYGPDADALLRELQNGGVAASRNIPRQK